MNKIKWLHKKRRPKKLIPFKVITLSVPTEYNHSTQLKTFVEENNVTNAFQRLSTHIDDSNFQRVSDLLHPGKRYSVKLFVCKGEVSTEECINFLKAENALFVGAQGLSLLYQLKKEEFPVGIFLVSLDIKENLFWWTKNNKVTRYLIPAMTRNADGSWEFHLPQYETVWDRGDCFLCFCES